MRLDPKEVARCLRMPESKLKCNASDENDLEAFTRAAFFDVMGYELPKEEFLSINRRGKGKG